jgi:hypothetical protein
LNGTYATTGSNTFAGIQTINSNLTVTGSITAQTLIVSTINATQSYSSGSNIFGNASSNTQTFTGSVNITGSTNLTGALSGTSATFSGAVVIGNDNAYALTIGRYSAGIPITYIKASTSSTGGFRLTNHNGADVIIVNGSNAITLDGATTTTGALSGSSATFSGNLNLQGAVTRNINFYDSSNTNINAQIQYDQISSNSGQLFFGTNNAGTFATRLTIASTGAATFSSSITASASSLFNANNGTLSADILTIRGGGGSGAFGFKVEANNGEDIFYTDHFTYNIIANPLGGKFGIGTTSPAFKLQVGNQNVSASLLVGSYAGLNPEYIIMGSENNGYGSSFFYRDMSTRAFPLVKMWINNASDGQTALDIQNAGGAGVSIVSKGQPLYIVKTSSSQGQVLFSTNHDSAGYVHTMYITADGPPNGAATGYSLGKNSGTNRSINAGGTINASGTDYAEYMTKAIEDNIAKGDIVGVDENGLLTNIFTNSKSFVVKSTDPSYIGGDTWFNEVRPLEDATQEEKDEFEARYQIARAKVDRIAFSGQVPCNVTGANVGDYIIPIQLENGKIGGQAVTNPTFEQYQKAVGKVWKIMDNGKAWIAVKIG